MSTGTGFGQHSKRRMSRFERTLDIKTDSGLVDMATNEIGGLVERPLDAHVAIRPQNADVV